MGSKKPEDAAQNNSDSEAIKEKMRAALEKKNAQQHSNAAGGAQVKGPHASAAGQQRRVFRRKSG